MTLLWCLAIWTLAGFGVVAAWAVAAMWAKRDDGTGARRQMSDSQTVRELIDHVMYGTVDPEVRLAGGPVPALTTLLHRVCDDDEQRFNEAVRLIELFILRTLNEAAKARADIKHPIGEH